MEFSGMINEIINSDYKDSKQIFNEETNKFEYINELSDLILEIVKKDFDLE